jgi:hypothetical protein
VILDEYIYKQLLEETGNMLHFTKSKEYKCKSEDALIITGNLSAWQYCCTKLSCVKGLREFSYKVYEILRKLGYDNVFRDFKVIEQIDGTKQLVRR